MIYCINCGAKVAKRFGDMPGGVEWYHVDTLKVLCLATVAEPANLP